MDTDVKAQFDKYKQNQQYHAERSATQNKERRKFADDLLSREKSATTQSTSEKDKKMTKEEMQREEVSYSSLSFLYFKLEQKNEEGVGERRREEERRT